MIIHYHYSCKESSGEIRRIKNINKFLAAQLSNEVIECAFISFVDYFSKKKERFVLSENVVKKYIFPMLPYSYSKVWAKRLNSIWTSLIIYFLIKKYKISTVVGEYASAWESARFCPKDTSLIIDIHGAIREEYEFENSNVNYRLSRYFDFVEEKGLVASNAVVCQSEEMKRHLLRKYNHLDSNKIFVYACKANIANFRIDMFLREHVRREMRVHDDETLFVYSGGLHKWQNVDKTIQYFINYNRLFPKSKLLILTGQVEKAHSLVQTIANSIVDSIIILSSPFDKVVEYLNAADAGFLLRDNVIMNAVAYPTKLAEYMACGLPVISTSVSAFWLKDTDADTYIFNIENKDITRLNSFLKSAKRESIAEYAVRELSIDSDLKEIERLLRYERSE